MNDTRTMHSLSLLVVPLLALCNACASPPTADTSGHFLFSYFTGNGEDGLHLAYSRDGYAWTALNDGRSFLRPTAGKDRLMRDPSVTRGPDGT